MPECQPGLSRDPDVHAEAAGGVAGQALVAGLERPPPAQEGAEPAPVSQGGDATARVVLATLITAGMPIARFERVVSPLGELIDRAIARSGLP